MSRKAWEMLLWRVLQIWVVGLKGLRPKRKDAQRQLRAHDEDQFAELLVAFILTFCKTILNLLMTGYQVRERS